VTAKYVTEGGALALWPCSLHKMLAQIPKTCPRAPFPLDLARPPNTNAYPSPIVSVSNFRGAGTQPVGGALSGFGTSDMAGNVKE
jgi:hypothetical protein